MRRYGAGGQRGSCCGARLAPGQAILGPAIVEEPFTTIVVYPGERATVDAVGNYTITRGRA